MTELIHPLLDPFQQLNNKTFYVKKDIRYLD